MIPNKDLVELLMGEKFQCLDINKRRIITEAAKCILRAQAFVDIALELLPHRTFERISLYAGYKYTKLSADIFGTPWPDPSVKLVPFEEK